MNRSTIYHNILDAFEHDFSWLGKQFAEEFLLSAASWNIQQYSKPPFRVRRHLLLYWAPGWLKSSLLVRAYDLLSEELCTMMTDITNAALRGTVDYGKFVSPFTLKRPFSVCTEFGQIVSGSDSSELIQKLLNVLEEGVVTVSLGKISQLSRVAKDEAERDYGITFIDDNTFTYRTNWVLLAGTYNRKFLVDNALESRFTLMIPENPLNSGLTKHLISTRQEGIDEETVHNFRRAICEKNEVKSDSRLPEEIFDNDENFNPRQCSAVLSYKMCRAWWGVKTSPEQLIRLSKAIKSRTSSVWKSADDKVFEAIEGEAKSADEIARETGLSRRQVYYSLKNIRASRIIDGEKAKWKII